MQVNDGDGRLISRALSMLARHIRKDRPFTLPSDITNSARLLFVDSGEETDLLFAAPVVNWFHERYPGIKTTLLVNNDDSALAKSLMKVHTILRYDRRQMKLIKTDYIALVRKLRSLYIETVMLLGRRMSLERQLLAFACGATTRIGFSNQASFPFLNCEIKVTDEKYEGDRMLGILGTLGLRGAELDRRLKLPQSDTGHAKQLIHFRMPEKGVLTVGIDPGRSKTRHKVIPEILAYLANNLAGRKKSKFLVLTYPWDEKLAGRFAGSLKSEVIDLAPSNSAEAVSLLSQCDLFLSGNTSLFHFAAALDVPAVGVFTKYDGSEWIPAYAGRARIFKGTKGEKLSLQAFFSRVDEVLSIKEGVSV